MADTTGRTRDAGWEVGVRRTFDVAPSTVWHFLLGEGLPLWLGEIDVLPTEKKAAYETGDGVRGTIRGYTDGYRVRLTWWPSDWPHDTTLQVTVKQAATGTTLAFHQENLADRDERRMMLGHWNTVVEAIERALA